MNSLKMDNLNQEIINANVDFNGWFPELKQ